MKKFVWGKVIDIFEYDFDGENVEVIKYNPWVVENSNVRSGNPDFDSVLYHSDDLSESFSTLEEFLIAWIANKKLGRNQYTLISGIARALGIK